MLFEQPLPKNLVILRAGGFAQEVAWLVSEINQYRSGSLILIGFLERGTNRVGQLINGVPVLSVEDVRRYLPEVYVLTAIDDLKAEENFSFKADSRYNTHRFLEKCRGKP